MQKEFCEFLIDIKKDLFFKLSLKMLGKHKNHFPFIRHAEKNDRHKKIIR
jgi:hypothetical protein